jgi:hypothetical protein
MSLIALKEFAHFFKSIKNSEKQVYQNDGCHYQFVKATVIFYQIFRHHIVLDNKWHLA